MAEIKTTGQETLADIESHVPETMHPILEAAFKYRKQLFIGVRAIIAATAPVCRIQCLQSSGHGRSPGPDGHHSYRKDRPGKDRRPGGIACLGPVLGETRHAAGTGPDRHEFQPNTTRLRTTGTNWPETRTTISRSWPAWARPSPCKWLANRPNAVTDSQGSARHHG